MKRYENSFHWKNIFEKIRDFRHICKPIRHVPVAICETLIKEVTNGWAISQLPENTKESGGHWARVEQCVYDPDRNSLRTRVVFNDLSVSGMVSLIPRDRRALISAESCRMTLRLRRAGIDFLTSPIARGRGQMRIRTESSFLEPRFASIYAYDCRSTRIDKQIKRQDKWPPYHSVNVKVG